jgi:hypothetical protein
MSGGQLSKPRSGNRTELLVEQWLHHFAFPVSVPYQEDVGHDQLCVLGEPHGDMTWAGPAFAVQTKSNRRPVVYAKPHALQWIKGQEIPLFIAVGDARAQSVSLYPTWQRVSAGMHPLRQRSCRFHLSFDGGRGSDGNVTKPFSLAFKQKMVVQLTGKDAASARSLARDTGSRRRRYRDGCVKHVARR